MQAAPAREDVEAMLSRIGFEEPTYFDLHEVPPTVGFTDAHEVEAAPSDESVTFYAALAHIRKPA